MIFYFTGTGNSLYAAKELDTDLISIPQAIHKSVQIYSAEKIGIVCPVYGHEMPMMVKDFLKNTEFVTDYFYIILTYGNRHAGAAKWAQEFLVSIEKSADYINVLLTVDNFLPSFDMAEQVKTAAAKKIPEQIAAIRRDIDARRKFISPVTDEDIAWHNEFVRRNRYVVANMDKAIYHITSSCIGCGICTKVCPAGCIHLENQRAVNTSENCQMCMACVHHCPEYAIRLNIGEINPDARYHNPNIRLNEIVEANEQSKYRKETKYNENEMYYIDTDSGSDYSELRGKYLCAKR
ncbi:MAG: EFR1 family ferrodoxin [Oscillospiraceae bacterium]|nr:EFR1 family ferrodoxin [Oscillospiraceae bacterium]